MQIKRTSDAATEPVTLTELKAHLRIDGTDEDTLLTSLIKVARITCEKYTKRAFITQTWQAWLDAFPSPESGPWAKEWWDGVREGPVSYLSTVQNKIYLPRPPLISVTHLKTYDASNNLETFSSTNYDVDVIGERGAIVLKYDKTWPTVMLRPSNGIVIEYVAGYGGASDVPEDIKYAVKVTAGYFYENRGKDCDTNELPMSARTVLEQYRIMRIGYDNQ